MTADFPKRALLVLLVLLVPVGGYAQEANESNANFGQPAFSANQQYFPRVLQLGFRATF